MDRPTRRDAADYVGLGPALLARAQAGASGVAASVIEPAALILGSAQPEADAATDLPIARRGTGGGAVLCDRGTLLIDLAVPRGHALAIEDVTDAYRPIGEALAGALDAVGATVVPVAVDDARAMDDARKAAARRACWAGISPYELCLPDGRKLVGLAQRRRSGAVLHQIAVPVTTAPAAVADHLVDGAALRPWLEATACLADVPECRVDTATRLWSVLRGTVATLVRS